MGRAARRKRQRTETPDHRKKGAEADPRVRAESALARLIEGNNPGRVSLAGAYALGYVSLALAQAEGEGPEWFYDVDPLETLFLGTAWPLEFRDAYEFSNACTAWLRLLGETPHWDGIERFTREALAASEEHDLPVDEGELMLLLAGRLEAAGLDQRKLPAGLHPERLLTGARCVIGPDLDLPLPDPPADAFERIAAFWSLVEAEFPGDGTVAGALREGLHMLGAASVDTRDEPILLLPALYGSLVAEEGEEMSEAAERSEAWALGLDADSPLVPVTDVLLIGPERGLSADDILGHLFALPAFTEDVRAQDCIWRSYPGHAFMSVAFGLGYRQVNTRDGEVIRLDPAAAEVFRSQTRVFEAKFGRPPRPGEPLFFDPDADEPRPLTREGLRDSATQLLQAAGACPAWMYAHDRTDGLMPLWDGSFSSERDASAWDAAIADYLETVEPGAEVDHAAEVAKLQTLLVRETLYIAARDSQYAADLVARMSDAAVSDSDTVLMARQLGASRSVLLAELRDNEQVLDRACEYARAWEGGELAAIVRAVADATDDAAPDPVLLAAAVAALPEDPENP